MGAAQLAGRARAGLGGLRRRIGGGGAARGVALLAGGSAIGQGLTLLAAPLLTRLYSPADFGLAAVYAGIVAIVLVVGPLSYPAAIPLPPDDRRAAHLAMVSLGLTVLGGSLLALLIYGQGALIAGLVGLPGLAPYLWLLPLSLVGAGVFQIAYYWTLRKQAYDDLARTRLNQSGGQLAIQIGMGLAGGGPLGLILGDLASRMSGSGLLLRRAWRRDREAWRAPAGGELREVATRYRKFPTLTTPAALINTVGLQLPAFVMAAFFGPLAAGWYALGQRVFSVPMELLGQAVGRVFYAEAAKRVHGAPDELGPLFWRNTLGLGLIGGLPIILFASCAPWAFAVIFGEQWRNAGLYLQILAPMFVLKIMVSPIQLLIVLERQGLDLLCEAVRFVAVAAAIAVAWAWHVSATEAIMLFSASGCVNYLFCLAVSWYALAAHRRREPAPMRQAS